MNLEFLNQKYFLLLLLLPFIIYLYYTRQKKGITFSFFSDIKSTYKKNIFSFYIKLILLSFIFLYYVIILANPNTTSVKENILKNGIDIVLILDVSNSMEATDLTPTRIEKAKQVLNEFISSQETNRLGLVVFAGKPFTSIPLTFDYSVLKETISNTTTSTINQNNSYLGGTAIGDAILMGETLFEKDELYKDREKVIILLTDGDANTGVDPVLASLSSKEKNIKIYTIGIGSEEGGTISYYSGPFLQTAKVPPLNDKALIEISNNTLGQYFKATDDLVFENIFKKLETLEKSLIEIEKENNYSPNYTYFVIILLILLFLFIVLTINKPEIKSNLD
ncbi:VWA domain-containing protein [Candidatus Gracilibacteria bacterium]|nr:VWA domain-containing protein [Candidatus Gracilibacteria bacterium]